MKKFGFTLVECLIALGIVGVIAAITTPAIRHILPDQDKIRVLKAHKIITDVNEEILSNKRWTMYASDNCIGLQCISINHPGFILNTTYDNILIDGIAKSFSYRAIFARHLNLAGDITPIGAGNGSGQAYLVFTTIDGWQWTIYNTNSGYTFGINFGDTKASPCTYNATSCQKPAWFSFFVDKHGNVYGNDPLTTAFLANPNKLNNNIDDYKTAKKDNTKYADVKIETTKKY